MAELDLVHDDITEAVAYLRTRITTRPEIGIICGSGLKALSEMVQDPITINYSEIPGFPSTAVHGHSAELVLGTLGGKQVLCMKGRFHFYEGYTQQTVAIASRVFCGVGVKLMIITNAAGGLNRSYKVADVMMLEDHFHFTGLAGQNPLRGPNDARFGTRFPPLNHLYGKEFQTLMFKCKDEVKWNRTLHKGCYGAMSGPCYETAHEVSALRTLGIDAVGMSTVPEAIMAGHAGLAVVGMSLITNECIGTDDDSSSAPNHKEVMEAAVLAQPEIQELVVKFCEQVDLSERKDVQGFLHFEKHFGGADGAEKAKLYLANRKKNNGDCSSCSISWPTVLVSVIAAATTSLLVSKLSKKK